MRVDDRLELARIDQPGRVSQYRCCRTTLPIYAVSAPNRRQSARVKAFVDDMADALAQAPELQPIK